MRVTLLGTSAGIPIAGRAQSGILIEYSDLKFLLDCGMGIPLRLAESGVSSEEIDIICITHGHLDHIQDLPSLTKASWLKTGRAAFKIILPKGLKKRLKAIWKMLDEYDRLQVQFNEIGPGEKFRNEDGVMIRAFRTQHTDMSLGYSITKDDKKIVYSGDGAPSSNLKKYAEGSDILIHELSEEEESEYHTDPEGLIKEIKDLEIEKLVLTHFYPGIEKKIEKIAQRIEKETKIATVAGKDLKSFDI